MFKNLKIKTTKPNGALIVVATFYKFTKYTHMALEIIREQLRTKCIASGIKGTLLLAPEGINGTISGTRSEVDTALDIIRNLPGCYDMEHKETLSYVLPFQKMKVRLKTEIVRMGVPGIDPNYNVGTYVEPEEWNTLISEPNTITIDTRNNYEVAIGTFKGSINPKTETFREFPQWVKTNISALKKQKIAMFCTGGIRCEKATSYLKELGFKKVYHLKGGILKYLETIPTKESLWKGECFVFDDRVSINHDLDVDNYKWCPIYDDPSLNNKICSSSNHIENI
ncbi:MAG: hypothetical protein TECD_00414 [Hyphomicrobiaceae bacterium hypho_1]